MTNSTQTNGDEKSMYGFLLNMWVMNRIDETYLDAQVQKGRITTEERDMILATPQL